LNTPLNNFVSNPFSHSTLRICITIFLQLLTYFEAFDKQDSWEDGTYELIGLHEQGNPYNLDTNILEKHGKRILNNVPRPERDGFAFIGWYDQNGNLFDEKIKIQNNEVYYARWAEIITDDEKDN